MISFEFSGFILSYKLFYVMLSYVEQYATLFIRMDGWTDGRMDG